jgi:hypothetical protein
MDNVGTFEFLGVESTNGDTVSFTTDKIGSYGTSGDDGIGAAREQQRVVLQRVPNYLNVTVQTGVAVTADAWDGVRGGVLALRSAGTVRIDGRLTMDGKGFAGGAPTTSPNTAGLQGESIAGIGVAATGANGGGGGGGPAARVGQACDGVALAGAGGAHRNAGEPPTAQSCGDVAAGGAPDGDIEARRMAQGSGGGAGGAPASLSDNPPGAAGGSGGGIVYLFAETVQGTGVISASGLRGEGDGAGVECTGPGSTECWDFSGPGGGGSGGFVVIRAPTVTFGALLVRGGAGGNGLDAQTGDGGSGGDGVLVVSGTN